MKFMIGRLRTQPKSEDRYPKCWLKLWGTAGSGPPGSLPAHWAPQPGPVLPTQREPVLLAKALGMGWAHTMWPMFPQHMRKLSPEPGSELVSKKMESQNKNGL